MKKKQISLLLHALSLFCFLLLFRLVFLILFYHSDYKQNSESLWPYLWLGAKFDLRLCLLVLLPLESLAAHKTSLFGNPLSTTPALKKIAKESLFYTNFYTSTTSIARSIFSSFVGMSDVSKVSKRYQ